MNAHEEDYQQAKTAPEDPMGATMGMVFEEPNLLELSRVERIRYCRPHRWILPRHHVGLWVCGGNGQRFAGLFRETWQRLPLWARRRILGHWKGMKAFRDGVPQLFAPRIELLDDWPDRNDGVWGSVRHRGCLMQFYAPDVDRMPENIVQDLVAHELAHVHQAAIGMQCRLDEHGHAAYYFEHWRGAAMDTGEVEDDADATMEHWGFDAYAMDDWSVRVGLSRVREMTLEECFEGWQNFHLTGRR